MSVVRTGGTVMRPCAAPMLSGPDKTEQAFTSTPPADAGSKDKNDRAMRDEEGERERTVRTVKE